MTLGIFGLIRIRAVKKVNISRNKNIPTSDKKLYNYSFAHKIICVFTLIIWLCIFGALSVVMI